MVDNTNLGKKLRNDVNRLQDKIENRNWYNIRNKIIRTILKSGIAIEYTLPFILAAIIQFNFQNAKGRNPFHTNQITEKAKVETIDTSSGIHQENISYKFNSDDPLIEHSTGWTINDKGLYERTETLYRFNQDIDLEDIDKILSMTKEEVDRAFVITDIKTIMKNTLKSEDYIYKTDAIIVVNHFKSDEKTITRSETPLETIGNSILFLICIASFGNVGRLFIKVYITNKMRKYESLFRPITQDELETLRKILKLKQENIALLNMDDALPPKKEFSYKLRKI